MYYKIKGKNVSETKSKRTQEDKENSYKKSRETCLKKYGVDSFSKTDMFKNQYTDEKKKEINSKVQQTNLDKYGYKYYAQTNEFKERVRKTNDSKTKEEKRLRIEKIQETRNNWTEEQKEINSQHISEGQLNMSDENKKRKSNNYKATNQKRYNANSYTQTEEYIEKTKETNRTKYNVDWYLQSEECKNKSIKTCLKKYGTEYYFQSDDFKKKFENSEWIKFINDKRYKTKKKNNTFNTSKIENQIKQYLDILGVNYEYQHTSNKYPFLCDFYFPDKDLYVEIQGSWTHGPHPFTNSEEDKILLEKWNSKNTKYYNNAVKTWTIRDVKKREVAKQNNLKYLEIFSCDLKKIITVLQQYIK